MLRGGWGSGSESPMAGPSGISPRPQHHQLADWWLQTLLQNRDHDRMSGSRPTGAKAPNEPWTDKSFHWAWAQFPQASSQEQTSVYPTFQTTEPAGTEPRSQR